MQKKIELLSPAGSMACLKAAVSKKADSVYLGMQSFSARSFATNFNDRYLKDAVNICKSNNVRLYLAMNTLVKGNEVKDFFVQLSKAYSCGIDAVILQEISFIDIIKRNYPDLRVHVSTQAGVMNSMHASLLKNSDRINLARELTKSEISEIRKNTPTELEVFCHGALCVSVSGMCIFSGFIGGRSGNRGRCAQSCRKTYDNRFLLSAKDLCLIDKIPDLISIGINSIKIEGRQRTPYYTAKTAEIYRKAIDSYYDGCFTVTNEMKKELYGAFSREFTCGWFNSSKDMFNTNSSAGKSSILNKEFYKVKSKGVFIGRKIISPNLPIIKEQASTEKRLLVKAYSPLDALTASDAGADVVYLDIFNPGFEDVKQQVKSKLFGFIPRIALDSDINGIADLIEQKKPDGVLAGNYSVLGLGLRIPIHLDYNLNFFNDYSIDYALKHGSMPIISPELSIKELSEIKNKNFAVMVHGKIILMNLRHKFDEGIVRDALNAEFLIKKIHHGIEILNGKELGMLSKAALLLKAGVNNFYIDTDREIGKIVRIYRKIIDGGKINDSSIKKDYVLGRLFRPVE